MKARQPVFCAMLLLLSGCAFTTARTPDGGAYATASLLENAAEKRRSYDPTTGQVTETVIAQNQTEGAKIIASGITTLRGIEELADFARHRLDTNAALDTAKITTSSDLSTLTETNRSAEALKALELTAP